MVKFIRTRIVKERLVMCIDPASPCMFSRAGEGCITVKSREFRAYNRSKSKMYLCRGYEERILY